MAYSGDTAQPTPEYLARKGEGAMTDEELHSVVQNALAQSVQWVDTELSPDRAAATDYYNGKLFGIEEEGRSKAILTEVRDAVDGMVPSLLRVFFGPEHTVEFVPTRPDNVEQAAQKTDYVRYVFEEDNCGFLETMAVLKDGLIRRLGIFKWGWDDSVETKAYKQEGVTEEQLKALAAADNVTLTKGGTTKRPDGFYDVSLTHTEKGGRAWVKALPPEEFIFNRQARSLDEALIVAHRTEKTRGQLIAMGIKTKDIESYGSAGESDITLRGNAEELARRALAPVGQTGTSAFANDPELGKANDKIQYTEAYMTVDYDGDGVAELRKLCCIGPSYYPVSNDPASDRPFAIFTPYPEPHTLQGGSVSDRTMDMQKINSALMRGMLDSMSVSLFPRPIYVEGQANVSDIMNNAIGAPIRERVAGAVRWTEVPFSGDKILPVLGFTQEVIERRTGRNKGAAGLDADALQSTGKEAVGAVLTGSQEQLELIARVIAESALKPMFKGLGRMIKDKQPRSRMVRLRGTWVDVDPRSWDDDMDVTVNVALGSTFVDDKVQTLMLAASDQKEFMTMLGLDNPVVTLPMLLNTRAKILSLKGIKDRENYYKTLPPDWQPPAPPQPPPDPEQMWIQAEKEMNHVKTMKELAIKQDELTLKREQADWDREFAVQKLATETAIKKYEIDATNHTAQTTAALDANIQEEARETELAIQAHDMLHDQSLERDAHEHEKMMNERAADTADMMAQQQPESE